MIEWKPGSVAMVKCSDGEWRRAFHYLYLGRWTWAFGDATFRDADTSEARPLVIIDPEDREQVERLFEAFDARFKAQTVGSACDDLQAALRSLLTDPLPRAWCARSYTNEVHRPHDHQGPDQMFRCPGREFSA